MGGFMSSSSLYRTVATVEIVTSVVITIFGVTTFLLFQQQDDLFQTEKEMILYSSIIAVVSSVLTLLSSILLVGCQPPPPPPRQMPHCESQWNGGEDGDENGEEQQQLPPPPPLPTSTQIGRQHALRRKTIAPTWLAWTLISISCLLFVFIAPIHYCIQAESDIQLLSRFTWRNGFYESTDNKRLGVCYSEAPHLQPIRNSLSDLYSFSFIGILFKALFMLMVYQNWKREQAKAKKVIIYVEACTGGAAGDSDISPGGAEPKIIVSSCSTANIGAEKDDEDFREMMKK